MTVTALLARLASRGYIPVSHGVTDYPENWLDLDGKAGQRPRRHPSGRRRPGRGVRTRPPARRAGALRHPAVGQHPGARDRGGAGRRRDLAGRAGPRPARRGTTQPAPAGNPARGARRAGRDRAPARQCRTVRPHPRPVRRPRHPLARPDQPRGTPDGTGDARLRPVPHRKPDAAQVIDWLLTLPRRKAPATASPRPGSGGNQAPLARPAPSAPCPLPSPGERDDTFRPVRRASRRDPPRPGRLPGRHPDWTPDGTWRGCQAWRHATGARVLVPAAGRYSDDGEILTETAVTIARVSLGIAPGDLRTAISRLAAVLAAHHPAARSPHRCRCGLPHPCPAFRAAAGLSPGKPRPQPAANRAGLPAPE